MFTVDTSVEVGAAEQFRVKKGREGEDLGGVAGGAGYETDGVGHGSRAGDSQDGASSKEEIDRFRDVFCFPEKDVEKMKLKHWPEIVRLLSRSAAQASEWV